MAEIATILLGIIGGLNAVLRFFYGKLIRNAIKRFYLSGKSPSSNGRSGGVLSEVALVASGKGEGGGRGGRWVGRGKQRRSGRGSSTGASDSSGESGEDASGCEARDDVDDDEGRSERESTAAADVNV